MEGNPYEIGGRAFVVPRLRVAAYERAVLGIQRAQKMGNGEDPAGIAQLEAACMAIMELLRENHPELTIEQVKDLVYLDELDTVLSGLLKAAGKKRAAPGEAQGP